MKKKFHLLFLLIPIVLSLFLSACGKKDNAKWNSGCFVALEGLPAEYEQLSDAIKDEITISLTLRHTSTNTMSYAKLTHQNSYSVYLDLIPGDYEIAGLYMSDKNLAMFDVKTDKKALTIHKDEQLRLPIQLTDPEGFVANILRNQASPEILALSPYSRKVQYDGQLLDLTSIRENMQFSIPENKMLKPAETYDIASSSHAGVAMVVQNQTSRAALVKDAVPVGFRFHSNHAIFPKGVRLGMGLTEIAHKETGILGTPSYCYGSLFFGIGYDQTTLVYLDEVSGDRISLTVDAEDSFISSILYEFERYE